MRSCLPVRRLLGIILLLAANPLSATDIWSGAAFSADAAALRQAAQTVKAEKHTDATVLINDLRFQFDESGKAVQTRHLIYRVETQKGVEGWAESSGYWKAWHQSRPEIRGRVITAEGTEHWLDSKTLNDVAVHSNVPETYSDQRKYGGPLPAVAIGAIVEEEVVTRDTAPMFAAGNVERWRLAWSAPVNRTHIVITHPVSVVFHYQLQLMPDAVVTKATENGVETITIENGPQAALQQHFPNLPPDVVDYPQLEFSTGSSWHELAAEYARLSEEKLKASEVQELLPTINVKDGSRLERIRRIVAAAHKNVRYTGIEFGESSLIPQLPSETLKRKYGDCKDKAALLVAMLRAAGIPANLALLDAGQGRDVNTELPGMGIFNHAIAYIPASGKEPELWVDATAQYSQVGTLPWMDYGRWALVVSDKTDQLKRTPELTAERNVYRELREFTLAEFGMATMSETFEEVGPAEADYRRYFSEDSKKVKEYCEGHVKNVFLADTLLSLSAGDVSDMDKPSSIKLTAKGRRGNTDFTIALAAIRLEGLFEELPQYFRTKEEPRKNESEEDKPKERAADWWVNPFAVEWRYRITAPLGYKLRALPSDKTEKVDLLTFTQKYTASADGTVVEAVLKVENTKQRITVEQAKSLRDAVIKARSADAILIGFDHVGHALISAGKIKEGLAAYRQVATQHPTEALHKIQLSQALLTAGLGEEARTVAREATVLEPKSAEAFSNLGVVLENDLIGRPAKKGMDHSGALAALQKAVELDPKDKEMLGRLAILLEYDANGTRYAEGAKLTEAVARIRELKKLDEEFEKEYEDNILYDLWYARDPKGVLEQAALLPASDERRGFKLAATAVLEGSDEALKRSLQMTTSDKERSTALESAGELLLRVRKYPEASALLAEAGNKQDSDGATMQRAALFGKTRPYEEVKSPASDPRAVVQEVFGRILSGKLTFEEFQSLTWGNIESSDSTPEKQFQQLVTSMKADSAGWGLPQVTVADLTLSNMHFSVDGDDSLGYKVIIEIPGESAQNVFVVREEGRYKVVASTIAGNSYLPEQFAFLVLQSAEKNNLKAAAKWLDRARESAHQNTGDDPLGDQPFPHFWIKGQKAELDVIRRAALVLMPSLELKGAYMAELIEARKAAKSGIERDRLGMVLAYAYLSQERWAEVPPLMQELMNSYPDSERVFNLAVAAYERLGKFEECDKLIQSRIQAHPDELAYVRASATFEAFRGEFKKARAILKTIIDKGQANDDDLNSYAWHMLSIAAPIDQETIDMAVRANDLSKNSNFSILHTLACIYAQAGKPSQARSLLLKAMESQRLEEPNSEVWFGFAMIAEQFGVLEAAVKIYGRVEKPKFEYPGATYTLAQQHLTAMHNLAKAGAKSAGQ